jgi:isoleucyl-tRNA synthetase
VQLQHHPILAQAIKENEHYIKSETLTDNLVLENEIAQGSEIEFDEIKTRILISK